MALTVLFAISLMILACSLASGSSVLVYSSVSRDDEPISYWIAIAIWAALVVATGGLSLWGLLEHKLP